MTKHRQSALILATDIDLTRRCNWSLSIAFPPFDRDPSPCDWFILQMKFQSNQNRPPAKVLSDRLL